ncbi:MAG: hypothetical protein PHW00_02750 [Clostridia bacterium]|nr:hypothetical protein [Clostridia bacterium]
MKMSQCIQLADLLLNTEIDTALFSKTQMDDQLSTALANKPLSLLVSCANIVLAEIANEYVPLVYKEDVNCVNGTVAYSTFAKDMLSVLRISDSNGARVRYRYRPDGIDIDSNKVCTVVYSYRPIYADFLDDVQVGKSVITERIIAFGTIAEYYLLTGKYEDAVLWDKRYKDSLLAVSGKKGEIRVKSRPLI